MSVEHADPPKSVPEAKSEVNLGEIKSKIEKEAVEEALGYLETLKNQTEELHRREVQEFENKASERHSEILNQETNAAQIGVSQRVEQERVRLNELASAQLEKSRKQLALEAGLRIAQIEQQMISAQQDSETARFETAASKNEALRQEQRAEEIKRDAEAALEKHRQITFSNMRQAGREMDDLIETVKRLEREKQLIITEATHALESAEKEKEWIQREAQIERLRLIKEAEIAVRHQASLAGSYQSESGSQVPQTHFMSRNSRPHNDSPAGNAQSQPSDEELEDGSKLTFPKVKPPRIPTTPRNSPRGRGTDPKVITATGTSTEKPKTVTGTGSSRPSNSRDPPDDEDKDKRDKRERDKKEKRDDRPRRGPPDDNGDDGDKEDGDKKDRDKKDKKDKEDKEKKDKKDKDRKPKGSPDDDGDDKDDDPDDEDDADDPFDSDDSDKVVASEAEKRAMKLLRKSIKATKDKFGKEADSFTVPNIGSAASHRAWRITARAKVVSASGKGIIAFRWFNEIAKAVTFEELDIDHCPKNMQRLDTKLHTAIAEKCHGTLGRQITQNVEDLEQVDIMMSGRQAVWMVYEFMKTNAKAGALFDLNDLMSIRLKGDKLEDFWSSWEATLSGMKKKPDDDTVKTLFLKQLK